MRNPANIERNTKAATDNSQEPDQSCADCGWPFGPDLTREVHADRVLTVCVDPWRCWERRETLRYMNGL